MVFYRKYRPQKIEELDLESVRDRLNSILKQKEIPHAFLFTGPKGLGKTSTARILAKAINCGSKKGIEPCNECDTCISITNGSNLDVLEIDAASNRGIDEIRELRERIKYAPAALSKKVYIIDEVHMLTTDAFNALLKTLEEPPSHAVFILATTEEDKIPPTILSRAFGITFKKPSKTEAIRSLERIVAGEKLAVEKGVLDEVLIYSEGSFRDASKVMEELVIAAAGGEITKELLDKIYNNQGLAKAAEDVVIALGEKDAAGALKVIQGTLDKGSDFKVFTEKIAEILHALMMKKCGIDTEAPSVGFDTAELSCLIDSVNESYRNIKSSILPSLPLELVVVNFCLSKNQNIKNVISQESDVIATLSTPAKPAKQDKKENENVEAIHDTPKKTQEAMADSAMEDGNTQTINNKPGYGMFAENAVPEHFFSALITNVKQDNHSIAGILRGCKLVSLGDKSVEFEAKYKFHRDKLNESKTSQILDKRASELLNRDVHVRVEMAQN